MIIYDHLADSGLLLFPCLGLWCAKHVGLAHGRVPSSAGQPAPSPEIEDAKNLGCGAAVKAVKKLWSFTSWRAPILKNHIENSDENSDENSTSWLLMHHEKQLRWSFVITTERHEKEMQGIRHRGKDWPEYHIPLKGTKHLPLHVLTNPASNFDCWPS